MAGLSPKCCRPICSPREAQARLDAATKDVRIQERRVNDLAEKHKLASTRLREAQSKQGQLDLDLKTRDAHIEKLRTQQQNAKNNKEYQAFLKQQVQCQRHLSYCQRMIRAGNAVSSAYWPWIISSLVLMGILVLLAALLW